MQRIIRPGAYKDCAEGNCMRDQDGAPKATAITLYYMVLHTLCSMMKVPPIAGGLRDQDAKTMEMFLIIENYERSKGEDGN